MRTGIALIFVLLLGGVTFAEIPQVISYQGRLTDASGIPVADGNYTMEFRIYDAVSGGTMLWYSGSRTVAVAGGVFSVMLGESPQPAIALDFSQDCWLEIVVAGYYQSPRERMGSVGYAYMASGLVPGTVVSGAVTGGTALTGWNSATTGQSIGVAGWSESAAGYGVYGAASASTGYTYGVLGSSSSPNGCGVYGYTWSSAGVTCGVRGESNSTAGRGVHGLATAGTGATFGVYGENASADGTGVLGYSSAMMGYTYGVAGESASTDGTGVRGRTLATAGSAYGVRGESASTAGRGVYGWASATTGVTCGVWGDSYSPDGRGVVGFASSFTGATYGVHGWTYSNAGRGVYGWASAGEGTTYGLYGRSDSPNGTGAYGEGGFCGLYGYSASGDGVRSFTDATNKSGVYGVNNLATGAAFGVYGRAYSPAGYAVYYSGNLAGTGTKSCVVRTSQGPTLMYCQESPENWFEDFGEGRLVNGRCHIELDPLFLQTVTVDAANPMKAFVELGGDCRGVYVKRGVTGFDVIELQGGVSSVPFTYRIVAKRKGFEGKRLDVCEAARGDSYLYPELKEKEFEEHEARDHESEAM